MAYTTMNYVLIDRIGTWKDVYKAYGSLNQLSKVAGVYPNALYRIFEGKGKTGAQAATKIAKAMDVDVDDIFVLK